MIYIKNNNTLIIIVVAVIVGAAAFFGGMQYQKMQRPQFGGLNGAGGGRFGGGGGRFGQNGGNRPVVGQIVSVDANGITVKLADGSTKIVVVPTSTSINKAATGTKSDLKTGETVAAFGTANSDGSITAQNVQLNPQMRGFGGPRPSVNPTK